MYPSSPALSEDPWNQLQQNRHATPLDPQYLRLLAALDQGWQIEAPVYLQPRFGPGSALIYLFILHHPATTELMLVRLPDSPEARQFVAREQLAVDTHGLQQ